MCSHMVLMAAYNAWMNQNLYRAAARLSPEELIADRGAFFGSLMGTLNHMVVADRIWLQRFASHPAQHSALDPIRYLPTPTALDQILFAELAALAEHRAMLDDIISTWVASLTETDLDYRLSYSDRKGVTHRKRLSSLLLHFFNHQTHHRGQATTLLTQAGQDVGVTDLLVLIPNETLN
ncbi:MAG: DinB family protein [Cyanobacteria bacterium]|nr:DinB family protein [Cyanobacteriota bacterium]MDW8200117.1 DinB family protein [Cyanobacteriota bacterium SKYGB_h_bin112]